jgi:glyoxylase-like metal-dependent hydrolase (beta-lactamase superfamily II)
VSDAAHVGEPAEALALAARAGIYPLSISTPFLVGRVNCYLIDDAPLTLVDTGPNSGTSLDELEQALATHGRSIEALELVVLTHQHMDHTGLLEIIVRRSGAEVAGFGPLAPWLAEYERSAADADAYAQEIMRRHGVPSEIVTVLGFVGAAFRTFGSGGVITTPLQDGDTLGLGDRALTVYHRPGHSPSDLVFVDDERRLAFGGDHLLSRISSNPLIDYIASLRASAELEIDVVLGGHGDPVTDHASLIAERLRLHERRARKIERILRKRPLSAHEIAVAMWGNVAVTQAFLTLSEVLGHLDVLVAEGRVVEREDGARSVFAVA